MVRTSKALILKDSPINYATLISEGTKKIETRKYKTSYRGDIVICASQGGDSPNAGKALCMVEIYHVEEMTTEHEAAACIEQYPKAQSWMLRNWRHFKEPFETKGRISGNPLGVCDISVPDDAELIQSTIPPYYPEK